jgi:hypothetical protein
MLGTKTRGKGLPEGVHSGFLFWKTWKSNIVRILSKLQMISLPPLNAHETKPTPPALSKLPIKPS